MHRFVRHCNTVLQYHCIDRYLNALDIQMALNCVNSSDCQSKPYLFGDRVDEPNVEILFLSDTCSQKRKTTFRRVIDLMVLNYVLTDRWLSKSNAKPSQSITICSNIVFMFAILQQNSKHKD